MKHVSLSIVFVFFISLYALAQKGDIRVGGGVEVGLPIGDFGKGHGIGFGVSARGMYGLNETGHATVTLGYQHFGMKNSTSEVSGSTGLIPFLLGYRHRFGQLYGEGQLGFTTVRSKVKVKGLEEFSDWIPGGFGGTASSTHFGYAIGGGYLLNEKFDLGLRLQGVSANGGNLTFLGVRVAYLIPLIK